MGSVRIAKRAVPFVAAVVAVVLAGLAIWYVSASQGGRRLPRAYGRSDTDASLARRPAGPLRAQGAAMSRIFAFTLGTLSAIGGFIDSSASNTVVNRAARADGCTLP